MNLALQGALVPSARDGLPLVEIPGLDILDTHKGAVMRPGEPGRKTLRRFATHWVVFLRRHQFSTRWAENWFRQT